MDKEQLVSLLQQHLNVSEVAKIIGKSRKHVYLLCQQHGITPQSVKFDHTFFHNINTEEKAYWLGFLYADGCIFDKGKGSKTLTLKLSKKDEEHINLFKTSLKCFLRTHYTGKNAWVKLCSNDLCDSLIKWGCVPRKSLVIKFPKWLPDSLIHHFFRGYFDGDGSSSHKKHHNIKSWTKKYSLRMSMIGTKPLLDAWQNIIYTRLNLSPVKLLKAGKAFAWEKAGNTQIPIIANWLYDGASIYIPRKREILFQKSRMILHE